MPAAKKRAAVTPVPLAVWLSPPQRFALVVPRVAHGTPMTVGVPRQRPQWCRCRDLSLLVSPAIPADTLSAGRPHKTAHAPRQRLAQAGAGSSRPRRASVVSSIRVAARRPRLLPHFVRAFACSSLFSRRPSPFVVASREARPLPVFNKPCDAISSRRSASREGGRRPNIPLSSCRHPAASSRSGKRNPP